MYIDISDKTNRVQGDWILDFLRAIWFEVQGYGMWKQTTISQLNNFIISDYELLYIDRGTVRLSIDGEPHVCKAGSLLLFEPFHVYSATCLPGEAVAYYYLHFDMQPLYIHREFRSLVTGGGSSLFQPEEIPDLSAMFQSTYQELADQRPGLVVLLYAGLLTTLVSMIRARNSQHDLEQMRSSRFHHSEAELVSRCVQFAEEHLSDQPRISTIADHLGVSQNHLYKVFRRVVRESPSRFLAMHRMKLAERALKQNKLLIGEIAESFGYGSVFHFSKVFKQYFGMSPQAYRKHIWR